jgi:hypothetical protein
MIIVIDTREKQPFEFAGQTISKKLDTGDYSIVGMESRITIDRKKSSSELAMCLGKYKDRFYRELERMRDFEKAYIICSFPLSHIHAFPRFTKIPKRLKRRIRTTPAFLLKSISKIEEEYGVEFIFCEDRESAEYETYSILRNYYEDNERSQEQA